MYVHTVPGADYLDCVFCASGSLSAASAGRKAAHAQDMTPKRILLEEQRILQQPERGYTQLQVIHITYVHIYRRLQLTLLARHATAKQTLFVHEN